MKITREGLTEGLKNAYNFTEAAATFSGVVVGAAEIAKHTLENPIGRELYLRVANPDIHNFVTGVIEAVDQAPFEAKCIVAGIAAFKGAQALARLKLYGPGTTDNQQEDNYAKANFVLRALAGKPAPQMNMNNKLAAKTQAEHRLASLTAGISGSSTASKPQTSVEEIEKTDPKRAEFLRMKAEMEAKKAQENGD